MSPMRKSARIAVVAGLLAGLAAPVAAQYQPYPPQPGPPQPRGRFAHACFPADQAAAYLRVEWPQSGRWAVYNQPYGSNIRVYIGDEPAQWCFSVRANEVLRPCRPGFTQPVQPGC
jgi:hypothetical protein